MTGPFPSLLTTAQAVRAGEASALEGVRAALANIHALDPLINAFTAVFDAEALEAAAAVDAARAAGRPLGPLAGAPFAVKNLFDVAGRVTLAGSRIRQSAPAAGKDAELVRRLKAAGAILVGALNMDEFAYGFVTENAHYGATRNPHDLTRIAGGSSGGSAAAVAAGLVPLTLGSDTNGSIRIPAALCGVFGLKPTSGRLPVDGMFPFVATLDHAGLFARSVEDLALAYDAGLDASGAPIFERLPELLAQPLRVGVLGGWFDAGLDPLARDAVAAAGRALAAEPGVILSSAEAARSAAFCLSAVEGGRLHLRDLADRLDEYDPAVGVRLLAGAFVPQSIYEAALAFRRHVSAEIAGHFRRFDLLLAPAAPGPASIVGEDALRVDGVAVSARKNLGLFTQPISFVGIPVIAAPASGGGLPTGVQILAPYGREDLAFAGAMKLQRAGVAAARAPLPVFSEAIAAAREMLTHDHQ